jgi:hypothetical protein
MGDDVNRDVRTTEFESEIKWERWIWLSEKARELTTMKETEK